MAAGELATLTGPTLWIYPTALTARAATRARVREHGAVVGPAALTFPELVDRLAVDLGVGRTLLRPPLARVVVARVLEQRGSPLGRRRGLARETHDVIEEFEAAHLDAAAVATLAARLTPGEAGQRLGEVATVYAAYERALDGLGAYDRHRRAWAVADALARHVEQGTCPLSLRGVGRVVFAEIYDYSVLQFLIATSVIRLVGDAELVAFAHAENVEATRFLDRTWNRFVGAEPIADQVLPSFVKRDGRSGSIGAALAGVFRHERPPPSAGDGSVRVLVGPHRYGEVEMVLREVRARLVRGEPAHRIALVARDLAPYRELVTDVARRFAIPLQLARRPSLLAAGAIRFVLDLWRCAVEDLPAERLGGVLASDYVRAGRGLSRRSLDRLGFVSERITPVEHCLAVARVRAAVPGRWLDRIEPALRGAVAAIRRLARPRVLAEHVRTLRQVLRRLGFRPVRREDAFPAIAERDARAVAVLDQALDELVALDAALAGGPLEAARALDLLTSVLADWPAEGAHDGAGGVWALSVHDARGLDFDRVYVLGLDDGTFPAARGESVLLPDWLRREVNPVAGEILRARLGSLGAGLPLGALLRTTREASLEDPFLFFLALSMPEHELVLCHPAADAAGTPLVRSPFIDEVEACLTTPLPVASVPPGLLVPAAAECAEVRELVARATLERWRPAGEGDGLAAALARRGAGMVDRLRSVDRRVGLERRRTRWFLLPSAAGAGREVASDASVGRVGDAAGLREAIAALTWSPTRIERLAACRFKFFAHDVLRLRAGEEAEMDIAPRERGDLLHRAIEAVLGELTVLPAQEDEAVRAARAVLRAHRTRLLTELPPKAAELTALSWEAIERAVDELVVLEHRRRHGRDADAEVSRRLEWPFEVDLAGSGGRPSLHLLGRVDRVDLVRRGDGGVLLEVTDYKGSRDRAAVARALGSTPVTARTAFQIPLYLEVARRRLLAPGEAGVLRGALVALLGPPSDDGKLVERRFEEEELAGVVDRAADLVAQAAAGRFEVDPAACDRWCRYRPVCRYQPPPFEDDGGG